MCTAYMLHNGGKKSDSIFFFYEIRFTFAMHCPGLSIHSQSESSELEMAPLLTCVLASMIGSHFDTTG